jgi:L-lactate dehydrogenase
LNQSERVFSPPATSVAIVGAGAVGSTIAYAAMLKGLAHKIVLTDVNESKAIAEAKDLMHGSMFVPSVEVKAGPLEACGEAGIVVVTAGAKQRPGQTRLQLAGANVSIFREMIPRIAAAAPQALLLIVSNPVDVLTYIAWKLSGQPAARVFGSGTVLDTSRFRSLIAAELDVAVANVHAYVIGEHGDSEVPLWSCAQIANIPLDAFHAPGRAPLNASERQKIFHGVRDAAAEVIAAKGATNWAVGLAVARILEAIQRDENAVLTVSRLVQDFHGCGDVCLAMPSLVGIDGVGPALPVDLSPDELAALRRSADILRGATRELGF